MPMKRQMIWFCQFHLREPQEAGKRTLPVQSVHLRLNGHQRELHAAEEEQLYLALSRLELQIEGLSGVWMVPLQDGAVKAAQEVGESEATGHAAAVLPRLLLELRQLLGQLGQLWAGTRHGQRGGRQVVLLQQGPAALHALCGKWEPKQEALYGRTDAGSCMEKHQ